jgi:hypothetical protein
MVGEEFEGEFEGKSEEESAETWLRGDLIRETIKTAKNLLNSLPYCSSKQPLDSAIQKYYNQTMTSRLFLDCLLNRTGVFSMVARRRCHGGDLCRLSRLTM